MNSAVELHDGTPLLDGQFEENASTLALAVICLDEVSVVARGTGQHSCILVHHISKVFESEFSKTHNSPCCEDTADGSPEKGKVDGFGKHDAIWLIDRFCEPKESREVYCSQ